MASPKQTVLMKVARLIESFVVFPDIPSNQALIAALWILHTWFVHRWQSTTYVHVRSDAAGQGKTTLLEIGKAMTPHPRLVPTMRALSVVRDIQTVKDETKQLPTYFFDQIEPITRQTGMLDDNMAILLSGYADGGDHVVLGKLYSTYCAKAFASIGDIQRDDLRSRCIVFRLGFGVPSRVWRDDVAKHTAECDSLLREFSALGLRDSAPAWQPPNWLVGRDREIWTPIWSMALALDLEPSVLMDIRTAIDEFNEVKASAERRTYRAIMIDAADAAAKDAVRLDGERLLRAVVGLLPVPDKTTTGNVHTAWLLERLRERGVWRVYKGKGIDALMLADLLKPFLPDGATNGEVRMVRGRKGKVAKGYRADQLRRALATLDADPLPPVA